MDRESKTLEWKAQVSRTFLKTVSAFANYGTGWIIFGIDDRGEVIGLDDPVDAARVIENMINDSLDPVPVFRISIDRLQATVTLLVEQGSNTPYLYQGKAFRRNDSSTVAVDRIELGRLVLAGENRTFDELDARSQTLSFGILEEEMRKKMDLSEVTMDTFRTLGLYTAQGTYTIAAELLADQNTFPGVDIVRYGRTSREIMERKKIAGVSVLSQFHQAMDMFRVNYAYEKIEGFRRVPRELIPEEAFREALANSLVHRAWDIPANVVVAMRGDRIEITSPGSLPPKITMQEYLGGNVSVMRNQLLATVFFRLGYIEWLGSGIGRIKDMYQNEGVKPSFVIREESIEVILPVVPDNDPVEQLSADERAVLESMPLGQAVARREISERAGMHDRAVLKGLRVLMRLGLVEQLGGGRSTRYVRA